MGPGKRRFAEGVKYAANGGSALFKLLLGLLANFTVIGSVAALGVVPFNACMARSASDLVSNRIKPTPLDNPVMLSQRILDVIIWPYGLKSDSRSCWVIPLDRPDTYKLAPLIESELGRANDTFIVLFCKRKPLNVLIALSASSVR